MARIVKDCFGTVISTLNKMKECVRCELLSECRSINWAAAEEPEPRVVMRHPASTEPDGETDLAGPSGVGGRPGGAAS